MWWRGVRVVCRTGSVGPLLRVGPVRLTVGTEPILVHHCSVNSWIHGWVYTLSLPRLFLISAFAVIAPSVAAVSVVSFLILHAHWTGLSVGSMICIALPSAAGVTLGERSRRRREVASANRIRTDEVSPTC